MPSTRLYKVDTKIKRQKQTFLVEATSQEQAIRIALDPLVTACTIPSPIQTAQLISQGVQILTKANAAEVVGASVADAQPELPTGEQQPEGNGQTDPAASNATTEGAAASDASDQLLTSGAGDTEGAGNG